MSPLYQGLTCEPTINVTGTCTIGGFPTYVVNVSTVADIQATVNMARNSNIRLVIKNTGHDFMGKSGGAGSLSVWTHHLKDLTFFESYNGSSNYSGPAFKVASGIQAWEVNEAAAERNLVIVGGEGKVHHSRNPLRRIRADMIHSRLLGYSEDISLEEGIRH